MTFVYFKREEKNKEKIAIIAEVSTLTIKLHVPVWSAKE